jgi:hypothetical protein
MNMPTYELTDQEVIMLLDLLESHQGLMDSVSKSTADPEELADKLTLGNADWEKAANIAKWADDAMNHPDFHMPRQEKGRRLPEGFDVRRIGDKFVVLLVHNGGHYIFRYAYPTLVEASGICASLTASFGKMNIDNDIRANYWPWPDDAKFRFAPMKPDSGHFHIFKE